MKTFLVDLDGVILNRADYFSSRAKKLYPNANHDAILDFFIGGMYKNISLGQADLVETLEEILPSWNVDVTVEELLQTWFSGENNIDADVLNRIQEIRSDGIKCIIATDHSMYRKNDVWENLNMKTSFDGIIASADVGATKEEPEFFQKSMEMFDTTDTSTLLFTDDDPKNIKVAESLGIKGIVFTGLPSLKDIK